MIRHWVLGLLLAGGLSIDGCASADYAWDTIVCHDTPSWSGVDYDDPETMLSVRYVAGTDDIAVDCQRYYCDDHDLSDAEESRIVQQAREIWEMACQ